MDVRTVGRVYGVGRVALGAGLLVAPGLMSRAWLGTPTSPEARAGRDVALRALGIRDVLLGAIQLHTLSHPQVGARWARTCAVADAVDALATLAARDRLPVTALGVVALAASGTATGLVVGARL